VHRRPGGLVPEHVDAAHERIGECIGFPLGCIVGLAHRWLAAVGAGARAPAPCARTRARSGAGRRAAADRRCRCGKYVIADRKGAAPERAPPHRRRRRCGREHPSVARRAQSRAGCAVARREVYRRGARRSTNSAAAASTWSCSALRITAAGSAAARAAAACSPAGAIALARIVPERGQLGKSMSNSRLLARALTAIARLIRCGRVLGSCERLSHVAGSASLRRPRQVICRWGHSYILECHSASSPLTCVHLDASVATSVTRPGVRLTSSSGPDVDAALRSSSTPTRVTRPGARLTSSSGPAVTRRYVLVPRQRASFGRRQAGVARRPPHERPSR